MANSSLIRVLFLYIKDLEDHNNKDFLDLKEKLNNNKKYEVEYCIAKEEIVNLLSPNVKTEDKFQVVLVYCRSSERSIWKDIFYKAKIHNRYAEMIVVLTEENSNQVSIGDAEQILIGGAFAFFQYPFNSDVLLAYLEGARQKCESRRTRAKLSRELNNLSANKEEITVGDVAKKIAEQLKELINAKDVEVNITLLKLSKNNQGYLRKQIYPELGLNLDLEKYPEAMWFIKPTKENEFITRILANDSTAIKRRVFRNIKEDKEVNRLYDVNSFVTFIRSIIVLPLQYAGETIGLIILFSKNEDAFDDVNEITLEQIANQSAVVLQYAEKNEIHQQFSQALNALNESNNLDETLEKLAEQACKLVNGLFSYIVMPKFNPEQLDFVAAWSKDDKTNYVEVLRERIPPFKKPENEDYKKKGITTLSFYKRKEYLLENIIDRKYKEEDNEARGAYYRHVYNSGNSEIQPSSNIALPIFLRPKNYSAQFTNTNMPLGVINVEHQDPFAFTEEQINALKQLADFAAIAIDNKARQDFVSKLYELIDFPDKEDLPFNKSPQNLEKFLSNIAIKMKDICGAELVTVHMVKDKKSFILGKSNETVNDAARWGNDDTMGHTFLAVKNREPLIITDAKKYRESPRDKRKNGSPIQINEKTNKNYNALFCFPMILKSNHKHEKVVGAIWIYFKADPDYSKEIIAVLEKFASNVADVINYAEKRTFEIIELDIKTAKNRDDILNKIVNSAKVYFGLRGASIYEVNRSMERLEAKASSFEETLFREKRFVSFSRENPEGLTGHLMRGKDEDGYSYSNWYVWIKDYRNYVHAMDYTEKEKEMLGSIIGIRFPIGVPANEAISILVVADEPIVENKGGRTYEDSLEDLKYLARIASESLQAMDNKKSENDSALTVISKEKVEILHRKIEEQDKNILSIEKRYIKIRKQWQWEGLGIFLISLYIIWTVNPFGVLLNNIANENEKAINNFFANLYLQALVVAYLVYRFWWQHEERPRKIIHGIIGLIVGGGLITALEFFRNIFLNK